MVDKITFFSSYYKVLKGMDDKSFVVVCRAMLAYMFEDTEPELDGLEKCVFEAVRTNIDISKKRAAAGREGGKSESKSEANLSKPQANLSKVEANLSKTEANSSKVQANTKQTESKLKANVKQNSSKPQAKVKQNEANLKHIDIDIDKDKDNDKDLDINKRVRARERFPNCPELESTWQDFKEMRLAIKHKMTDRAEDLMEKQLRTLAVNPFGEFDTEMAIAILEQSIKNSWQGIFPLRQEGEPWNRKRAASGGTVDWDNV